MPVGLTPDEKEKLKQGLVKYSKKGASKDDLRKFRDAFISGLKKKGGGQPVSGSPQGQPTKPSAPSFGQKVMTETLVSGEPVMKGVKKEPQKKQQDITFRREEMPSETTQAQIPQPIKVAKEVEKKAEQGKFVQSPVATVSKEKGTDFTSEEAIKNVNKAAFEKSQKALEDKGVTILSKDDIDKQISNEYEAQFGEEIESYMANAGNKSNKFFPYFTVAPTDLTDLQIALGEREVPNGTTIEKEGKRGEMVSALMDDYFEYMRKTRPEVAEAEFNKYSVLKPNADRSAKDEEWLHSMETRAIQLKMAALKRNFDKQKAGINEYSKIEASIDSRLFDAGVIALNQERAAIDAEYKRLEQKAKESFSAWGERDKEFNKAIQDLNAKSSTMKREDYEAEFNRISQEYQKEYNAYKANYPDFSKLQERSNKLQSDYEDLKVRSRMTDENVAKLEQAKTAYNSLGQSALSMKVLGTLNQDNLNYYPEYKILKERIEKEKEAGKQRWDNASPFMKMVYAAGELANTFTAGIGNMAINVLEIPKIVEDLVTGNTEYNFLDEIYDGLENYRMEKQVDFPTIESDSSLQYLTSLGGNALSSLATFALGGTFGGASKMGQFGATFATSWLVTEADAYEEAINTHKMSPRQAAAASTATAIAVSLAEGLIPDVKYFEPGAFRKSILNDLASGKSLSQAFRDSFDDSAKSYLKSGLKETGEEVLQQGVDNAVKEIINYLGETEYFKDLNSSRGYKDAALSGLIGGKAGNFFRRPVGASNFSEEVMLEAAENADGIIAASTNSADVAKVKQDLKGPREDFQALSAHPNWKNLPRPKQARAFGITQQIRTLEEGGLKDPVTNAQIERLKNEREEILMLGENGIDAKAVGTSTTPQRVKVGEDYANFFINEDGDYEIEYNNGRSVIIEKGEGVAEKIREMGIETDEGIVGDMNIENQNTLITPTLEKGATINYAGKNATLNNYAEKNGKIVSVNITTEDGRNLQIREGQQGNSKQLLENLNALKYDKENQVRVSSEVGEGQKPVEAQPVAAKGEEAAPTSGVLQAPEEEVGPPEITPEDVKANMKPLTDGMANTELIFDQEGFNIDWDYDNEIIITDKKTGIVLDALELPEFLLPLAAQYEEATSILAGYDLGIYQEALKESRRDIGGIETEFEEVKPAALPEKTEPAKPSRKERLAGLFKGEEKPAKEEKAESPKGRDRIEYVANKLRDKVKDLVGNAKGALSRNEANIFKKEIESLEKKAIQQGTFSYDEKRGNANYEKVNGKEQKVNTYEADGYKIEYESTPKSSFVDVTTPSGERIRLIDPTYKNQANQEAIFFPAAQAETKPAVTQEQPTGKTSEQDGEKLSNFKKGDVVYRNYNGRYEEYTIENTDKSVWKLVSPEGRTSDWNAENNEGFILKQAAPQEAAKQASTRQGKIASLFEQEEVPRVEKQISDEAFVDEKIEQVKENGKPLSEFKEGDRVIWASDSNPNFKQYIEGVVVKENGELGIKRSSQNPLSKKYPVAILGGSTRVIMKPEGDPIYTGAENLAKKQAVKTVEEKPQAPKGEPSSVTASDGWTFVRMPNGTYTDGDQVYGSWEQLKEVGQKEDLGLRQSTPEEEERARKTGEEEGTFEAAMEVYASTQKAVETPPAETKEASNKAVNELITKKNRYNKIPKTKKAIGANLLNQIKQEAENLGFNVVNVKGGNISLTSKDSGKIVARRDVDRKFNQERNNKLKEAKSMAGDSLFGLRGSVLLYFLGGGKVKTSQSELAGEKEIEAAKRAGFIADNGRSVDMIVLEDLPAMGGIVFDEQDAINEVLDVLASFENKTQMEDELVEMVDKLNRDMNDAMKYRSISEMNEALDKNELDENQLREYYEALSEDEKVKSIEDYEKFYQEVERQQSDREGKGAYGVDTSTQQKAQEESVEPLLAPNGKPSKLNPEQYKYVRTKEFKDWFGDWENDPENASKVIDENGEPLVVYHASMEAFTTFEIKPPKSERDKIWREKNTSRRVPNGFYFTDDKEAAMEFAVQKEGSTLADEGALLDLNLIPAFLNIKKPDQKYLKEPPYYLPNLLSQNKYILEDLETGYIDGLISGYGYLYLHSSVRYEESWGDPEDARPEEIWGKEFIVTSNSQIRIADPELLIKDGPNEGYTRTDTAAGPFVSESGNIPYSEPSGVRGEDIRSGGVGNTVKAVWNKYKQIKFNGSVRVKDAGDVAHIMRKLEDKSVEHAFAVHVTKRGKTHIQFLGMGGPTGTVVDPRLILAGVKKFKSAKVYLVHNHPSGSLVASSEDVRLTDRVEKILSPLGIELEHVIMDTYKKQYVHLLPDGISEILKRDVNKESLAEYNKMLKTEVMDEQRILSQPVKDIKNSSDVAEFLMQVRFTALPKHGMLLLNNQNQIIGNYIFKKGFNYDEAVSFYSEAAAGTGVIFYSNQNEYYGGVKPLIGLFDAALIKVYDYVLVNSDSEGVKGYYTSFADSDKLNETQAKYGTNSIPNELREPTPRTNAEIQGLMEEAADAVEAAIGSGTEAQKAVNDIVGSQDWYIELSPKLKQQFNEILQDDFGVTPKAQPKAKAPAAKPATKGGTDIQNIVDNYYKLKDGDRSARAAINEILDADPKLKYIYNNISKINKQLQDAGVITEKTDGCP